MRIISGKARGTKLYTLDGNDITRPTLDRIKESLFSIIQEKLIDSIVLDLFAGSGALGLESISRGAEKAYLCDKNKKSIEIIKKNIQKCHMENETTVIFDDFKKCIEKINQKVDIIFIDPPYESNLAIEAVKQILKQNILNNKSLIIIETDDELREINQIKDLKNLEIIDTRKYGRVKLIFLNRKGI